MGIVIDAAHRRPQGGLAVTLDIPREANPRREILPLLMLSFRRWKTRITGEKHARRRRVVLGAASPVVERGLAVKDRTAVQIDHRDVRLPAETIADCQPLTD